jgi:formylglycine-generating enzyme required for sulfatase activity
MGKNPSHFIGSNRPVEKVSWNDIQEFIRKLNQQTGLNYRLPTEAEWEYGCHSGGETQKYCGSDNINNVAWYFLNSEGETHPVGKKQPNKLGLYDMSGNVWEIVHDWYDANYYNTSTPINPKGPENGSVKIFRGGSWYNSARFGRSSFRNYDFSGSRLSILGFRLARTR